MPIYLSSIALPTLGIAIKGATSFFSQEKEKKQKTFGRLKGSRMKNMRDLAINPRKGRKKGKAVRIDLVEWL